MNITRSTLTILGVLMIGAGLIARTPAHTATPRREARIEQRAIQQQKRIAQGVASGALTPKETARLERREAKIGRDIVRAEADGKITRQEAARINHEQNRASRAIKRQKHDRQYHKG